MRHSTIVAVTYLLITIYQLILRDYDPTSFFRGMDGQLFYWIALDPLNAWKLFGSAASYRYQRILYPILARGLALGQPEWIPWMMIAIDFVSVILGTELIGLILKKYGKNPYYSLLYGLYVGQLLAYSYALAEPLMSMLVTAGVYASVVNRWRLASAAFAVAVFTKEIALLFVAGYVLWLFSKRDLKQAMSLVLVAVVPFAIYQALMSLWFRQFAFFAPTVNTFETIPLYGIYYWRDSTANLFKIAYVILIPLVAGVFFCILDVWKRRADHITLYILFNALFMVFMTHAVYQDIASFSRTAIGLNIALISYAPAHSGNKILNLITIWTLPFVVWFVLRMPELFLNY